MARVVIVGGGYGGVTVAKGLDSLAEVILIEQKDQFVHHAAALRAAVDDVWEHAIFMPYSRLLKNGRVVHGTVSRIDGTTVSIFGQDPIEADYLVLATGSSYPFPAKYSSSRSSVAKARLEQLHENLAAAQSVLIVGGGTVGIELTGELANAFPNLEITIVERENNILMASGYTDELRNEIRRQLDDLGVHVITGSPLAYLPPINIGALGHFTVATQMQIKVEADLWFQCYGARASTGYLDATEYERLLHPDGTICVSGTLQVKDHDNVYAIGDITDIRESKRADAARQQARVVISNLSMQLKGEMPDAQYLPTKDWVILPLGPNMGASQLLDAEGTIRIVSSEQTAEIKGTDLMMSVVRSQLNLP